MGWQLLFSILLAKPGSLVQAQAGLVLTTNHVSHYRECADACAKEHRASFGCYTEDQWNLPPLPQEGSWYECCGWVYVGVHAAQPSKNLIWAWNNPECDACYTNFDAGQPNDYRGNDEDCVGVHRDFSDRWHDTPCNMRARCLCNKNLPPFNLVDAVFGLAAAADSDNMQCTDLCEAESSAKAQVHSWKCRPGTTPTTTTTTFSTTTTTTLAPTPAPTPAPPPPPPGGKYKLSDCDPQQIVVDENMNTRKVVQTEDMVHDLCKKVDPPKENADMMKDCRAFCSVGGENLGFPVLLGSEFYGFDLKQMEETCTTIFEGDATSATVCVDNSLANYKIQLATSYYLAAVEQFEQEQMIFTADMDAQSDKLIKNFKDPMFIDDLDEKVPSEKLEVVKTMIDDWIAKTKQKTDGSSDMQDAVDNLAEKGEQMVTTVTAELPRFKEFVQYCNQDMLGFGREKEAVLDICSQDSLACVEKEEASHVGCCCGVNYVATAPKYMIDGLKHPRLKGGRSRRLHSNETAAREMARVLAEARSLQDQDNFDICSAAKKVNKQYMEKTQSKMGIGAAGAVEKQERMKKCKYVDYYTTCPNQANARRLEEVGEDEVADTAQALESTFDDSTEVDDAMEFTSVETKSTEPQNSKPSLPEWLQGGKDRKLQDFSCFPPLVDETSMEPVDTCPSGSQGPSCLKVTFTKYTNQRCDTLQTKFEEGEEMPAGESCKLLNKDFAGTECKSSDVMDSLCKEFCKPIGIPIPFGNEYFGFSLDKVASICGGSVKYNRDLLDDCAVNASAFKEIKFKTSAFIAQQKIFEAAKDNYIAAVRDAVQVVSEHMLSEEVREKMLNSMDKPKTYKAELEKKRADIEEAPKRLVMKEMDRLQTKADSLLKTLQSDIPKLTHALKNCNDLFLATGSDRSYLLDNCWGAKAGPRCFEDKKSTHAGCCCAYNPVTQFGRNDKRYAPVIDGTSAIPGATVGSRRLQKGSKKSSRRLQACEGSDQVVDICAEAWTESAQPIQKIYKDATPSGKAVMQESQATTKAKYPEYCDALNARLTKSGASPTPSGGSPTPSGGSPSPSGGAPTPSGGSPSPSGGSSGGPSGGSSGGEGEKGKAPAAAADTQQQADHAVHQAPSRTAAQLLLALMVLSNVW